MAPGERAVNASMTNVERGTVDANPRNAHPDWRLIGIRIVRPHAVEVMRGCPEFKLLVLRERRLVRSPPREVLPQEA